MLDRFEQANRAESLRRWLGSVDLASANILEVERSIYNALAQTNRKQNFFVQPISPLAEPISLPELLGDTLTATQDEVRYQAGRLDNLYQYLVETNNVLNAEMESAERMIIEATDDIQAMTMAYGDEHRNYYWVGDTFNHHGFLNKNTTTALIDTDYGQATLSPIDTVVLTNFTPQIDFENTKGLPGANLLVLNMSGKTSTGEPNPQGAPTESTNFGSVFDANASTYFEVERNFIKPDQKLELQGRSYVMSQSGDIRNVIEVTKNFDWKVNVEWPNGFVDTGPDGNGVLVAEFVDLTSLTEKALENYGSNNALLSKKGGGSVVDKNAKLGIFISFEGPTHVSNIRLVPFTRESESGTFIQIESIQAQLDNSEWVAIAQNVRLGDSTSLTRLQREIMHRTGVSSLGGLYPIPTDRSLLAIKIILKSSPVKAKYGFRHIYVDALTRFKTTRNHGLWRTVDKRERWRRAPFNEKPPQLKIDFSENGIIGSLKGASNSIIGLNNVFKAVDKSLAAASLPAVGGTLGQVASWLGKATPYAVGLLALDALVGGLFAVKKEVKVLEQRLGYDIFDGWRASVGLRDVMLSRDVFAPESIIESVKREFPGPVSKVALFVDEFIPPDWGLGTWIRYYLSTDSQNWIEVDQMQNTTLEGALQLETPSKEIYFRAVIKGNPLDVHHTPVVKHYTIQGLPVQ